MTGAVTVIPDARMYRSHAALLQRGKVFRVVRVGEDLKGLVFDGMIVHPDIFDEMKAKLEKDGGFGP